MFSKIEDFLLNKFAGKLLARGAVIASGWLAGLALSQAGVHLDQAELQGAMILAANSLFEWFKAKRMANPASPAVQTDASKLPAPPAA